MKKAMRVLQEGGFILRVSAKRNGRSELVRLTAKGLAAADRVIAEIARVMEQVTIESRSTDQGIGVLDRSMRKFMNVKTVKLGAPAKNDAVERRVSQG